MEQTIFDKIIEGTIPSWKVLENENYLAFLTPFTAMKGQTVIIPKQNPGDYIFKMNDDEYVKLLQFAKEVSVILDKAFNTVRTIMIVEGFEVPYVHVKLIPVTHDMTIELGTGGPQTSKEEMDQILEKILSIK